MTIAIVGADPLVGLAELMLKSDEQRASLDDESIRAAREQQRQALEQQVNLLHAAADDVRTGAFIQGGAVMLGAAASGFACGTSPAGKPDKAGLVALDKAGSAVQQMAKPVSDELGEAPRMDAEAKAKQAEIKGNLAAERSEEALHHQQRLEQASDRTLDTLGASLESESQGNLAIIANV
jgi:hypothetical protein